MERSVGLAAADYSPSNTACQRAAKLGARIDYAGYRVHLPGGASLHWPALPHNPYRKDGRAGPSEGRIEIRIPFDQGDREHQIRLEIVE